VTKFFEVLAALEHDQFAPKTFLQSDNIVVILVDLKATVKATSRKILEEDEVHIWYFEDRKVV
jgi:hypothetical protein